MNSWSQQPLCYFLFPNGWSFCSKVIFTGTHTTIQQPFIVVICISVNTPSLIGCGVYGIHPCRGLGGKYWASTPQHCWYAVQSWAGLRAPAAGNMASSWARANEGTKFPTNIQIRFLHHVQHQLQNGCGLRAHHGYRIVTSVWYHQIG